MTTVADLPLGRSWPMSAYEARRYRKSFGMSDEAGRDRCTALWKTYSVKCTTEEEEETEFEEDRKRGHESEEGRKRGKIPKEQHTKTKSNGS